MMVADVFTDNVAASSPSTDMIVVGESLNRPSATDNSRSNRMSSSFSKESKEKSFKRGIAKDAMVLEEGDRKTSGSATEIRSVSSSPKKEASQKEKKKKSSASSSSSSSSSSSKMRSSGSSSGSCTSTGTSATTEITNQALEAGSNTKDSPEPSSGSRSNHSQSTTKIKNGNKHRDTSKKKKKKSSKKTADSSSGSAKKSRPPDTKATRERRELSFASIHGRSLHKSNKKRGGIGNSPAVLSRDDSENNVKKKSALKQKREEQQRKLREQSEGSSAVDSKVLGNQKEDSTQNDTDAADPSGNASSGSVTAVDSYSCSNSSIDDDCSIVSDGSYSADDLLLGDSQEPTSSSSINPGDLYGGSFCGSSSNTSYSNECSFANADGNEASYGTNVGDEKRVGHGNERSESVSSIISSDTITPCLASSMSSFPEEDVNFVSSDDGSSDEDVSEASSTTISSPETSPIGNPNTLPPPIALSEHPEGAPAPTIPRERSIDFNERVRVKRVLCQSQLVEEDELEDLWFQPEEYEAIKRKTMALIRAIQEENTGGVTYCTRGLERYFCIQEVQDKRNDAWDTVLDEQDLQRYEGAPDPERLSRLYARCTRRSSQEAVVRGKLDEDAIARYTRKTRQALGRSSHGRVA